MKTDVPRLPRTRCVAAQRQGFRCVRTWRWGGLGLTVGLFAGLLLLWQGEGLRQAVRSIPAPAAMSVPSVAPRAQTPGARLLAPVDIARLNLAAADSLPGAEALDVERSLAELDAWAVHAIAETERNLYRFRQQPAEYENSEGYFRLLMLAVVVCEDFGVRYNPGRISAPGESILSGGIGVAPVAIVTGPAASVPPSPPSGGEGARRAGEGEARGGDGFFADSQGLFLHGLLGERRMGTCSSMPVLYVALARRLGYPVSLATTKGHLFARWEGRGERFNVECIGRGMNRYDDAHYRQWPFVLSDQEIQENAYLRSLTPAGEAAVFLSLRAECLREAGRLEEARQCYAGAARLAPEVRLYATLAGQSPGPLAGPILLPSPELAPSPPGRAGSQMPGSGASSVPLPEAPNPLKRIQQ